METNHTENNIKNKDVQAKPFCHLWWENKETGVRTYAGIAFYNERFNEYRLKLDALGDKQPFYCRTEGFVDEAIRYRVEVVKRRQGQFWRRQKVGEGYSHAIETEGNILLEIPPYNSGHRLVMAFYSEEENEAV